VLTGQLSEPVATYPYGFTDPEAALYHLALIGRLVNVAFVVGTVALTYGIGRRLLGRRVGLLAAWFAATAYPLVYYAHTSNQDAAYLFWLTLSLWAVVVATRPGLGAPLVPARWPLWALGLAAGMSMATKEQGFAFLLALPMILVVSGYRRAITPGGAWRRLYDATWNPGTRAGLAIAVLTWLVAGNAFLNPRGFLNRLSDLTGNPVPGLSSRVTPVEFSPFKGFAKESAYVTDFVDVVSSTFGLPLFLVALAGLAYLLIRRRHATLCLLVPLAFYYYLSLRSHHVLTLRYTLPVVPIFAVAAAWVCVEALRSRVPIAGPVVVALALLGLARAVELNLVLYDDPRYAAEEWLAANVVDGATVETYQKQVYMPRMGDLRAVEVALSERTISGLLDRRPDAIVLSSASRKTISHFWTEDWRKGDGGLLTEVPEAAAMLRALEAGELPYRETARFTREPWLVRSRITSVAPQIRVFQPLADQPE